MSKKPEPDTMPQEILDARIVIATAAGAYSDLVGRINTVIALNELAAIIALDLIREPPSRKELRRGVTSHDPREDGHDVTIQ